MKRKIKKKHLVRLSRIGTLFSIVLVVANIILTLTGNSISYAGVGDAIADTGEMAISGIAAILAFFLKYIVWFFAEALYAIIKGIIKEGGGLEAVLFAGSTAAGIKKAPILSVEFFDFNPTGPGKEAAKTFRLSIAQWYYVIRLIAVAALLLILIYVGIRMALSSVASEEAKYKKMLTNWATSMALLFLLHYIIVITISVNASLVDSFSGLVRADLGDDGDQTVGEYFIDTLRDEILGVSENVKGLFCACILAVYMGETLAFLAFYIKRMVTTGFLIMIAPLITITYSIDKMGDGKAQALNAWLKEFVFNILIQPFHCILYLAFFGAVADLMEADDVGIMGYILALFLSLFIHKAEDLLRKIFNFQTQSMGSVMQNTQGLMNATGTFTKGAAAVTTGGIALAKGVGRMASSGRQAISARRDTTAMKKLLNGMSDEERMQAKFVGKVNRKNVAAFLESDNGKELFKETKRYKAKKERSRLFGGRFHKEATIERNTQEDMKNQTYSYDGNSNMSYDDTVRAAKQGSTEAQAALDRQKQISTEKAEREYKPPKIQRARGAIRKVGDKISDFRDSDFGKASGAVTKQLLTRGIDIFGLSAGAGVFGNLQGAISGQQIVSGLSQPLLNNTTKTAKKETAGLAEKVIALSGKSKEDFPQYSEQIWIAGKYNHKYDNMSQQFSDFAENFARATGCKTEQAEALATEIQLGIAKDKNFDVEGLVKSYIERFGENISEEIKKAQIDSAKDKALTFGESMIYSQMEYAEDKLGIDHAEYISDVTNKISEYRIEQNQTINITQTTTGANREAEYARQRFYRESRERARESAERESARDEDNDEDNNL